jgi:hypothetical protein
MKERTGAYMRKQKKRRETPLQQALAQVKKEYPQLPKNRRKVIARLMVLKDRAKRLEALAGGEVTF